MGEIKMLMVASPTLWEQALLYGWITGTLVVLLVVGYGIERGTRYAFPKRKAPSPRIRSPHRPAPAPPVMKKTG